MDKFLGKFDIRTQQSDHFRYCGKQTTTTADGITIDVSDQILKVRPIAIEPTLQPQEISQLRSVVG